MLQVRKKPGRLVLTDMSKGKRVTLDLNNDLDWISLEVARYEQKNHTWYYESSHTLLKDHVVPVLNIIGETLDEFGPLKIKK